MSIWQDIRYGVRSLAKHRNVTAVSLAVLSLGIGANSALFTVTNCVLLRPVPGIQNPREVVRLIRIQRGEEYSNFGYPDYVDYRDQNRSLTGLIAERGIPFSVIHTVTERIPGAVVTGNYFAVLGVRAARGRMIVPDDDRAPGGTPVAVISHRFWQNQLAGDEAVIGRKLMLNGYAYTVVGVAAEKFHGMSIGQQTDVWVPVMMQHEAMPRYSTTNFLTLRSAGWLNVYGRLHPGVSLDQARTELGALSRVLQLRYPDTNTDRTVTLTRDVGLDPDQHRSLSSLLGLLLASVALLLLIACQNVANLFLTRAAARKREIAVRIALGASRWQLIRQLMTESLLLCFCAAALGLLIAPSAVALALKFLGPADPALRAPASADGTVLMFTLGLTVVTALLCGLAPALQASRTDVVTSLKATTPAAGQLKPGRAPRLATLLVIGQVAISAVLLIGAGLVVKTMAGILGIQRGFQSERVLLAAVDLAIQRYSEPQGKLFCERLAQRLAAAPEVESVSLSKSEPARDWSDRRPVFYPEQEPAPDVLRRRPDLGLMVDANRISPGYFRTLGIPLVAGRDFAWRDRDGAPPVAIVSETLAKRMWPNQGAVGKRIAAPNSGGPPRLPLEIVGVARDAKYRSILADPPLLLYEPLMQSYDSFVSIAVRTRNDPASFAGTLRREMAALDPNLALYNVRTFSEQVNRSLWQQRSAAALIGIFGLISLVLASIGLYSQLAHSVATRTREIGIRMALGADALVVRRTIVRQGILMAGCGAAAGLLVAILLARFVENFLYGVTARDPVTFCLAWTTLVLVTIPASYFPARAATRIDPMIALRNS